MIETARISISTAAPKFGAHERSFPRKSAVPRRRRRPAGHCLECWVPMRPRAERKSLGGVRSRQASDQRQHGYIKREPAHRQILTLNGSRQEIVPPQAGTLEGANVRFGSKADMCSAKGHVRSTPRKQTCAAHKPMSAFQERTHALQKSQGNLIHRTHAIC